MNGFCLVLTTLFLVSCAPPVEQERTSISFKMPKSDRSKRSARRFTKLNVVGQGHYGSANVGIIDDIDCYMVAAAYPDPAISVAVSGSCGNGTDLFNNIHIASSTVPDGGEIILENVLAGESREFLVIGFQHTSNGTACPDLRNLTQSDYPNMSRPVVVGKAVQGIVAGSENIVNIQVTMTNATQLQGCWNPPFQALGRFDQTNYGNAVFGP